MARPIEDIERDLATARKRFEAIPGKDRSERVAELETELAEAHED